MPALSQKTGITLLDKHEQLYLCSRNSLNNKTRAKPEYTLTMMGQNWINTSRSHARIAEIRMQCNENEGTKSEYTVREKIGLAGESPFETRLKSFLRAIKICNYLASPSFL